MIFFNETVTAPFSGIILQRKVNISAVAGDSSIVLSLWDPHGVQYDFTIQAGQKLQQRDFDLFRFQIQGSGQAAIALSYPVIGLDPALTTRSFLHIMLDPYVRELKLYDMGVVDVDRFSRMKSASSIIAW